MMTMLDYIYEEKESLSSILASRVEKNDLLPQKRFEKVSHLLILATGSSYNACLSAKTALESLGDVFVDIQEPAHFEHYGRLSPAVDLVLAVSQSGKSASTIEAVRKMKKQAISTIALTSDPTSPLALETDQIIDLGIGIETVGFVTKGYSATVLQLILLGIDIGKSKHQLDEEREAAYLTELQRIIDDLPRIIEQTERFFEANQSLFRLAKRFIAIGYGPNWGTAKEVETKFTETIREPSQGFELEAYMHGPYLEADTSHLLFFIDTNSENSERLEKLNRYMSRFTGETFIVTTKKSSNEKDLSLDIACEETVSVLALIVPFQLLAYRIATAKGIDLNTKIFEDFDEVLKSKI